MGSALAGIRRIEDGSVQSLPLCGLAQIELLEPACRLGGASLVIG
jgi:hypothetical protein